jgi:hypothetical protein
MHKGQEGRNVKTHYKFDDNSMKMCFKHKTRMKVNHIIKNIRVTMYKNYHNLTNFNIYQSFMHHDRNL